MSIIEIQNLNIYNGNKKLLNNVNLTLQSGKIVALIGKSGNGKSLTANALLGFLAENLTMGGEFLYNGENLKNFKRSQILSVIMQNPRSAFDPLYTMKNNAIETLAFTKAKKSDFGYKIKNAFLQAGLNQPERIYDLYPFEMSGGMLQRVMIALALLQDTPFMIADEPTTDLDLIVQNKILNILKGTINAKNLGMLLITHDFGIIAKMADFVYVIDNGEIIESGTTKEIFYSPNHNVTKELIKTHLRFYKDNL